MTNLKLVRTTTGSLAIRYLPKTVDMPQRPAAPRAAMRLRGSSGLIAKPDRQSRTETR